MIHTLKLEHRIGRQAEDDWETVLPDDFQFWNISIPLIGQRNYTHDGCEIEVKVDWSPTVSKLKLDLDVITKLYAHEPVDSELAWKHIQLETQAT